MADYDLLVQTSRLYYELGETQQRIAEILGVTRPQVSRLLKQARAEGIVEIRIVDSTREDSPAAERLRNRFGLRAVHLAPTLSGPEDLTRRMVGRLAAQVFRDAVRGGMLVGVGAGASVSATIDALAELEPPLELTVIPLSGGGWHPSPLADPVRRLAAKFGGLAHELPAPGLVDDPKTRDSLLSLAGVQNVVGLYDRLDVALFGIGGPDWSEPWLTPEIVKELVAAGAVGEVLISPFDIEGRFVSEQMRRVTIGFDARDLGRVPVTFAVAAGPGKVKAILGALRAGICKILVTDVSTAAAVVELDEERPAQAPVAVGPGQEASPTGGRVG